MARLWFLTASVTFACVAIWTACTGDDPEISAPTNDGGASDSPSAVADASSVFTVTASPADAGLVRQGSTFEVRFDRTGGRGTAKVKAQLAPVSSDISIPGDFTHLEGQAAQTFVVSVGATAAQRDYELSFFANDEAVPAAQASTKLGFRVIGPPGGIDQTFGDGDAGNGIVLVPNAPFTSLLVLPDGKLLAAGGTASDFVLVRLDANGKLDPMFGAGGIVRDTVNAGGGIAAIARDGNDIIAAGGVGQIVVRRYSVSGTAASIVDTDATGLQVNDMVLSTDGKIVVAGGVAARANHFAAKFALATGAPDTSFGPGGIVETKVSASGTAGERATTVAALPDGRVVTGGRTFVTGSTDGQIALVRYIPDGGLDPTFGSNGTFVYQFGQGFEEEVKSLTVTGDGGIHFVSEQTRNKEGRVVTVSRLLPNGERDPQWWPAPNPEGYSLFASRDGGAIPRRAVELDGGAWLVAGTNGSSQLALVGRVSATAEVDPSFGVGGFSTFAVGVGSTQATRAAIDSAGYVIVVGINGSNGFVARLFP